MLSKNAQPFLNVVLNIKNQLLILRIKNVRDGFLNANSKYTQ